MRGAWVFQAFGYLPCELCLKQRLAYYYGIPLAVFLVFMVQGTRYQSLVGPAFVALALIFAANSVFGLYHSGVEWGFWPGPSECSGAASSAATVGDFLKQLETVKVVRCDAVAIRILGLSLAGWNAVICAALSALGFIGARQTLSLQKA
eukprot:gene12753-12850_t